MFYQTITGGGGGQGGFGGGGIHVEQVHGML